MLKQFYLGQFWIERAQKSQSLDTSTTKPYLSVREGEVSNHYFSLLTLLVHPILFLGSIEVEVTHMPVPSPTKLQYVLRLTRADLVVVEDVPIVVVLVRVGDLIPFIDIAST